jgi:hypothetical protein
MHGPMNVKFGQTEFHTKKEKEMVSSECHRVVNAEQQFFPYKMKRLGI